MSNDSIPESEWDHDEHFSKLKEYGVPYSLIAKSAYEFGVQHGEERVKALQTFVHQHGEDKPPANAKQAFTQFLTIAGFKSMNIGSSLGGADDSTPVYLTFFMLMGKGDIEYRLGTRSESFVFDKDGNLIGGPLDS